MYMMVGGTGGGGAVEFAARLTYKSDAGAIFATNVGLRLGTRRPFDHDAISL
jgi:hypothetical protein